MVTDDWLLVYHCPVNGAGPIPASHHASLKPHLLKEVLVVCLEEKVQDAGNLVQLLAAQQGRIDERPIGGPVGQKPCQHVAGIQHGDGQVHLGQVLARRIATMLLQLPLQELSTLVAALLRDLPSQALRRLEQVLMHLTRLLIGGGGVAEQSASTEWSSNAEVVLFNLLF